MSTEERKIQWIKIILALIYGSAVVFLLYKIPYG